MTAYGKAKLILFDLDGTLYLDGVPYPGARELLQRLKESDMEYGFLTNNSSIFRLCNNYIFRSYNNVN